MRVVGAAVVRTDPVTGRRIVLAAQRREPPHLAGLWEFPGGKVEPGESDVQALRRELAEELCVTAEIGGRVGPDINLGPGTSGPAQPGPAQPGTAQLEPAQPYGVLVVHLVTVTGEPRALDHAELRWLGAEQLDDVPWIPVDRPVVTALRALLS